MKFGAREVPMNDRHAQTYILNGPLRSELQVILDRPFLPTLEHSKVLILAKHSTRKLQLAPFDSKINSYSQKSKLYYLGW